MRADPSHAKFATARKAPSSALIERDDEIALALTALLSGEPAPGRPPGSAKALLLDSRLARTGGTKFTTPE